MVRKQYFLVSSSSRNMARKQYFLVCPPSRNMARKQYFDSWFAHLQDTWLGNNISWFSHLQETWLGNNVSWFVHLQNTVLQNATSETKSHFARIMRLHRSNLKLRSTVIRNVEFNRFRRRILHAQNSSH